MSHETYGLDCNFGDGKFACVIETDFTVRHSVAVSEIMLKLKTRTHSLPARTLCSISSSYECCQSCNSIRASSMYLHMSPCDRLIVQLAGNIGETEIYRW